MNEQITILLQKRGVVPTVVGVVALASGIGIGYILGKRKATKLVKLLAEAGVESVEKVETTTTTYDIELDDGTEIVRSYPAPLGDPTSTLADGEAEEDEEDRLLTREEFHEVLHRPLISDPDNQPPDVVLNETEEDGWNYETELSTRTADEPYVIHCDEYFADEMGFVQSTLTYYKGDNILVDENTVPIYNHDKTVGELKFGYGSKDPNVVYIRNEKFQGEYEVLLEPGFYAVEVLGQEIESEYSEGDLKHSLQKFRDSD